jgi:hypothetical protein
MALRELLQVRGSSLYRDGVFKRVPRRENCTNMLWDYAEMQISAYFSAVNVEVVMIPSLIFMP